MKSMTGFAQGRFSVGTKTVFVQFKSFNNRYLEVSYRGTGLTPEAERLLREMVKTTIFRGKVEIVCDVFENNPAQWTIQLNDMLLVDILEKLQTFKKKYRENVSLTLDPLLKLPMIFHLDPTSDPWNGADAPELKTGVEKVLESFLATRRQEGEAIAADLLTSLDVIDRTLGEIQGLEKQVEEEAFATFRAKIERILGGVAVDEKRLAQEAALAVEKSSIAEEVNRLATHARRLRQLILQPAPDTQGREADFLTQEMQRETHTIAAKTSSLGIHESILLTRREIDKIRQQVQNIE